MDKYVMLEVEIIVFEEDDVIIASPFGSDTTMEPRSINDEEEE